MSAFSILNTVNSGSGLPITKTFSVPSGFSAENVLLVSGSAQSLTHRDTLLQVEVLIDDSVVGTLKLFSNELAIHRAFPTGMFPVNLAAGSSHTLTLRDLEPSAITTDINDYFSATLVG